MNAAFCGPLYLGPRAHPNDGLVDVTIGRLPFRDRWAARDRMRSGAHLPHPALRTSRAREWSATLERPTPVSVDGVRRATAQQIRVVVRPDALRVVC
jgi:diacylglycerol kinase family enzyme